jgi:thiol-disulfide isomerase/thioredoxin
MPTDTSLVVDGYQESKDSWKKDHERLKTDCWALEDKIAQGLNYYHGIRMADLSWSRAVGMSGGAKFDPAIARLLHAEYTSWLKPCDEIIDALSEVQKNYKVEQAEAFLDAARLARRRAAVDIERLIASVEERNRGEAVPLDEGKWDELLADNNAHRAT